MPQDKPRYVAFMAQLRTRLTTLQRANGRADRPYLISLASAAGEWTLSPGYDLTGITAHVGFFNVMTYDRQCDAGGCNSND